MLSADSEFHIQHSAFSVRYSSCLLYTSDAADERSSVDLGGRRIINKKKNRRKKKKKDKKKKKTDKEDCSSTNTPVSEARDTEYGHEDMHGP